MLVRKKYLVQKSFRIDRDLESDLSILAEVTNRSQNDLVNNAIQSFLIENGIWFLEYALVEHYSGIIELTGGEYDPIFKMGGLTVELFNENGFYKIHYTLEENKKIVEDYTKEISVSSDDAETELKEYLIFLSQHIDSKSEDAKRYLNERLDYNDFTQAKK